LGGPPYIWCKNEKVVVREPIGEKDFDKIFKKSSKKVLEWAQYICGLVIDNEDEEPPSEPREIHFDPNRPLASLMENLPPEHECIV
jgi:hypothetical protein